MAEILNRLREATKQLHSDIEKDNIANKVVDHSISLTEYKLLLFQNYMAYKAAEAEVEKFIPEYKASKTYQLEQDLKGLGLLDINSTLDFHCQNKAEAIGAAYVIEGSAMGGILIGKELKSCGSLNSIPNQLFFTGERSSMQGWNSYLKYLRSCEFSEQEITAASNKAKETFLLFKQAFGLELSNS